MPDSAGGSEPHPPPTTPASDPPTPDPEARLRSPAYVRLLVVAAVLGVPVSVAAYYFLHIVGRIQRWVFTDLPQQLGFAGPPWWWPLPPLVISGVLVALCIARLPGNGGHSPADGFAAGVRPSPAELPGILLAAVASLGLGVVLGPEAPLIAIGAGLGVCAVRLSRRDVPAQAAAVVAAAGSFAAISALMGSPILGAFLLMEAAGLGGPTLGLVLLPGLLASGIGTLVFIGLNSLTGLGVEPLSIPGLPSYTHPDIAQFAYAILIGLLAAPAGVFLRRFALIVRPHVDRHRLALTPVVGLAVGCCAIVYALTTGRAATEVLFSGQSALGPLLLNAAGYPVGALVILLLCKWVAYGLSLSAFRGGPVFPAMFVGATGGLALSHLPDLPPVAGAAMGIGAMCAVMLKLPMTSVLLATLLLLSDGLTVMPLVIVAVVVAHVAAARLEPVGAGPITHTR
jgi:chloride channel protein, CIC family